MTDLTYEQIEVEFMRQIRLCSGLGRWRMIELVANSEDFILDGLDPPEYRDAAKRAVLARYEKDEQPEELTEFSADCLRAISEFLLRLKDKKA